MLAYSFGVMGVVSSCKKARVIKCDLCQHQATGLACAGTCPAEALQCTDIEKVQQHRPRQQLVRNVPPVFLNVGIVHFVYAGRG